ncbi:hypothetical protein BHE74_00034771 [Ensete ventricosum]|nr:hypothetical protein BHE74_00034771 [Ensete ventricosum]
MYLSLPLPSTATRTITVTVFSGDGSSLPMPFTVTVPKDGCCKDLIQALSTASCLKHTEALVLAEVRYNQHYYGYLANFQVYGNRIYRYLENSFESLTNIKDEELIVAYRLPIHHEKLLRLEILHRREG